MTNAFADGSPQHVVGPIAGAGFFVGRNVWRHQPGHILIGPNMARALSAFDRRRSWPGPISVRVTTEASVHAIDQIFSPGQPGWGGFEFSIRERALLGPDDRTPADGESDAESDNENQYQKNEAKNLCPTTSCHLLIVSCLC